MIRSAVLWIALATIAGIGLFFLKYEVKSLERELARTEQRIEENRVAIHVLRAEWSHLNDPERLRRLAEKHLELEPVDPARVIALDQWAAPGGGTLAELPRAEAEDAR